ncbi:sugar phosphate isomerase/epimerase, partial [bacterium]|nr:sugar phosphate isomerase/epimerase [bacterium]
MKLQNYEIKREKLVQQFKKTLTDNPELKNQKLKLSWSNWGFGIESLEDTAKRLSSNGLEWIELHGNRYGDDLGYNAKEVNEILEKYNMKAAGVCGMFGPENDLSSNSGISRQNAIDYIRRQIDLCKEVGG